MSGVVSNVKQGAAAIASDISDVGTDLKHGQLLKGVGDLASASITSGAFMASGGQLASTVHGALNPGSAGIIGGAAAGFEQPGGAGSLLMGSAPQTPNIAIQDPNAVAAANASAKAAAARQAQIDQMTTTPGRGGGTSGSILTDNYAYRT